MKRIIDDRLRAAACLALLGTACGTGMGALEDRGIELMPKDVVFFATVPSVEALLRGTGRDHLATQHAAVYREMMSDLTRDVGFDPLNPAEIAARGLDPARPMGVALVDSEDELGAAYAHLLDEAKLVLFASAAAQREKEKRQTETIAGATIHRFGDEACMTVRGDRVFLAWTDRRRAEAKMFELCVSAASRTPDASLAANPALAAATEAVDGRGHLLVWAGVGALLRDILGARATSEDPEDPLPARLLARTLAAGSGVALRATLTPTGADLALHAPLAVKNPLLEILLNAPAAFTGTLVPAQAALAVAVAFRPEKAAALLETLAILEPAFLEQIRGQDPKLWTGQAVIGGTCGRQEETDPLGCTSELALGVDAARAKDALAPVLAASGGRAALSGRFLVVGEDKSPRSTPAPDPGLEEGPARALALMIRPAASAAIWAFALGSALSSLGEHKFDDDANPRRREIEVIQAERQKARRAHDRASGKALWQATYPLMLATASVTLEDTAIGAVGQLSFGSGTWAGFIDGAVLAVREQEARNQAWQKADRDFDRRLEALRGTPPGGDPR